VGVPRQQGQVRDPVQGAARFEGGRGVEGEGAQRGEPARGPAVNRAAGAVHQALVHEYRDNGHEMNQVRRRK